MKRFLYATWALVVCGGLVHCKTEDEPCDPFVPQDELVEVTVVGRSVSDAFTPSFIAGLPSCGASDLDVGDRYSITLSKHVPFNQGGSVCYSYECPLDFPAPATSLSDSAGSYPLNYVCTNTNAKVTLAPNCEVGRYVGLYTRGRPASLFAQQGGEAPVYKLIRAFTRTSGGAVCSDLDARFPNRSEPAKDLLCADEVDVTFSQR